MRLIKAFMHSDIEDAFLENSFEEYYKDILNYVTIAFNAHDSSNKFGKVMTMLQALLLLRKL